MSAVHAAVMASAVSGLGYQIPFSVRLKASVPSYFFRTYTATGNSQIFTWDGWVKRGRLGLAYLIGAQNTGAQTWETLQFDATDQLVFDYDPGTAQYKYTAVGVFFRDPTAWYHIHLEIDTTQAVAANRTKIVVNGTQLTLTANGAGGNVPQNYNTRFNVNGNTAGLGTPVTYVTPNGGGASTFDGLMAYVNYVDGQAVAVSNFAEVPPASNYWVPKAYTGTYGVNGYLCEWKNFTAATAAAVGKDTAPIFGTHTVANNWTPSGISVTAGATFDQFTDTPTNNVATLFPLATPVTVTFRNANMEFCGLTSAAHRTACASITLPPTGNWYWEITAASTDSNEMIGIVDLLGGTTNLPASGAEIGKRGASVFDYGYRSDSGKWSQNSTSAYGATFTAGDVIGVNWNSDAQTLTFYKNNASQGVAYSGITQQAGRFAPASSTAESSVYEAYNFGQRPFVYTPPSGALPLNTANLVSAAVLLSGSFTGNAAADGPVQLINGNPATLTINGNVVTFGTHADKTAGGFKLRTASASYNAAGTNNWTATAGNRFVSTAKIPNNARVNP
jgi:hypothetical protein